MQKIKDTIAASILILMVGLSGCTFKNKMSNVNTMDIAQLENVSQDAIQLPSGSDAGHMRNKLLEDTSLSLGAQGGLAWATEKINLQLNKDGPYLNTIFNFDAMMLSHGVIPPVLLESSNSLNLADPMTIRVADKTYQIIEQARFSTTAPNWRDYLWMTYTKPSLPDKTLLPRNAAEQKIWRESVRKGWQKGIEQSHSIFKQNLARLKRDYQGMILYRKLLQYKMINPPFVSRTELGVTGDGDDMRVNDQVLRIVELPRLQTKSNRWNAVVVKQ